MPGKPSRRDRRRRGTAAERRPRPAPPVSPGRIVRAARSATPPEAPEDTATTAPEPTPAVPAQAPVAAQNGARVRGRGVGALRRGATSSARALEAQREERIRRDSVRDLRSIGLAAAVTAVALVAAAVFL